MVTNTIYQCQKSLSNCIVIWIWNNKSTNSSMRHLSKWGNKTANKTLLVNMMCMTWQGNIWRPCSRYQMEHVYVVLYSRFMYEVNRIYFWQYIYCIFGLKPDHHLQYKNKHLKKDFKQLTMNKLSSLMQNLIFITFGTQMLYTLYMNKSPHV